MVVMKKIIPVVAAVIIRKDGRCVLLRYRDTDESPEAEKTWECPGGRIEYREDPEHALEREIREELGGYQLSIGRLLHVQSNVYSSGKHYLVLYYQCSIWPEYEPDNCRWYKLDDVIELPTLPGTREAIQAYLNN